MLAAAVKLGYSGFPWTAVTSMWSSGKKNNVGTRQQTLNLEGCWECHEWWKKISGRKISRAICCPAFASRNVSGCSLTCCHFSLFPPYGWASTSPSLDIWAIHHLSPRCIWVVFCPCNASLAVTTLFCLPLLPKGCVMLTPMWRHQETGRWGPRVEPN